MALAIHGRKLRRMVIAAALAVAAQIQGGDSFAHETMTEDVSFGCKVANVAGTFTYLGHPFYQPGPQVVENQTCVVIVGGTLSDTRDGGMDRKGAPPRDALKRLAKQLASAGYASLRYDRVGHGGSQPTKAWTGTYHDEAEVALSAIEFARKRKNVERVIVAGESAGAYVACLAAAAGAQADGYIFLGGHCDSGAAIYEYNFKRLVDLAEGDPTWRDWAEKNAQFELALGRRYPEMFAAAKAGQEKFEVVDGDFRRSIGLARRKEELDLPPDEMYRQIKKPALALSGEFDLNVPPDHAARIVKIVRESGNHNCTCVKIASADHSFQLAAKTAPERLRERYNFESFRREYSPQLYEEIVNWLDRTFGKAAKEAKLPADVKPGKLPTRAIEQSERDPKTSTSTAKLYLAPGIQIVEDVNDRTQTTGVETLEGKIGPLLLGNDSQVHFIEMRPGMYCEEHPHSNESMIYTVRGRWVLCSGGRRQVMKPGSLFHFAANTPTGYETPFAENALILIFKGQRLTDKDEDFVEYLKGMAARLEREHEAGVPYRLKDLPPDHRAIEFAKSVNPDFGK